MNSNIAIPAQNVPALLYPTENEVSIVIGQPQRMCFERGLHGVSAELGKLQEFILIGISRVEAGIEQTLTGSDIIIE